MDATAGQCAIKYVAPGTQGETLEKLMLEGAVLCPGHYVCRPEVRGKEGEEEEKEEKRVIE